MMQLLMEVIVYKKDFRRLFQVHDKENSGFVSPTEFQEVLRTNTFLSEDQIHHVHSHYNPTGKTKINYVLFSEFLLKGRFSVASQHLKVHEDLIPYLVFKILENQEIGRIKKLQDAFAQAINSNNLNFSTFNTYLDNWVPNMSMDMKFEMYIPLCTTSSDQFMTEGFSNFLNTAGTEGKKSDP